MLKILKQPKALSANNGDFIYTEPSVNGYFRTIDEKEYYGLQAAKDGVLVPFGLFGDSAVKVMGNEQIFGSFGKELFAEMQYDDYVPLPGGELRASVAMVPLLWFTHKGEAFGAAVAKLPPYLRDTANDDGFLRSQLVAKNYRNLVPNNLDKVLMGSGYMMDGFYPEHGSSAIVPVAMDTQEGDVLIFAAHCWYNK